MTYRSLAPRRRAELLGTLAKLSWILAGPALIVLILGAALAAATLALPLAIVVLNSWAAKAAGEAWNELQWEEACARDPRLVEVRELERRTFGGRLPPCPH